MYNKNIELLINNKKYNVMNFTVYTYENLFDNTLRIKTYDLELINLFKYKNVANFLRDNGFCNHSIYDYGKNMFHKASFIINDENLIFSVYKIYLEQIQFNIVEIPECEAKLGYELITKFKNYEVKNY